MYFHYDTSIHVYNLFLLYSSPHYALLLSLLVPLPEAGIISQMGVRDGGFGWAKPHNL